MKLKNILQFLPFLRRFAKAREAVSALEYAILVGIIVAAVAGALVAFSGNVEKAVKGIGTKIEATKDSADTPDLTP